MAEQICAARRCSNPVPPKKAQGGPPKLYCSIACNDAERKSRKRERAPEREGFGICSTPGCGRQCAAPSPKGPIPIYCSRNCAQSAKMRAERAARGPILEVVLCPGCDREFTKQRPSRQKFCSPLCRIRVKNRELGILPLDERHRLQREQAIAAQPIHKCQLESCSAEFRGRLHHNRLPRWYCTSEHYVADRLLKGAMWIPPAPLEQRDFRSGARRVKAAGFGAAVEFFSLAEILERDAWRCRLCGVKTPLDLRGTQAQNAPEVDHIVPIARGGGHTRANCWCLCHRCNHAKGNKLLEELPPPMLKLFDSIDGEG